MKENNWAICKHKKYWSTIIFLFSLSRYANVILGTKGIGINKYILIQYNVV